MFRLEAVNCPRNLYRRMQKTKRVFVVLMVLVVVTIGVYFQSTLSFSLVPIRRLLLQQQVPITTTTTTTTVKTPIKLKQLYPKHRTHLAEPHSSPQPANDPQTKNEGNLITSQNISKVSIPSSLPSIPPLPSWLGAGKVTPQFPYLNPSLEALPGTPDVFQDLPVNATDKDGKKYKIILYWNEIYGNKHFGFGFGHNPFILAGCRVNTCLTTGDRHRYPLEEVDAVLWHLRSNDKSFPTKRYPKNHYVFWMMESASYPFADLRKYNRKFNLTFTYRRDADVYNPYGRLFLRRHPLPLPPESVNYAKGKTKMAAWFVSNCHTMSKRENFVDRLKAWIEVDIYGRCGPLKCDRSIHGQCLGMVEKDYKFYFSFENSLCQDYVTEKFFGALSINVIPVVYGLGNYSAIAPPHSYIDALAFPSPRALAEYLQYLNANDTAYNEYFWWKPYYHQTHDWAKKSMAFCDLCERLHDDTPKTYDLKKWFIDDSHCFTSYETATGRQRVRISRAVILKD
ncbi:alpha-(1,3)-fucosyltransferase C-like isoform X3 [Scylla paramamosain]|uniref:alpha-(1,3)-fucosyltransferase C-like isoform X3 n=1 Tax=Scylla paramamosain TaxID=85552 RepID=UPI00308379AC